MMNHENEDMMIKLIRLIANMSIHPTIGTAFAREEHIIILAKLLSNQYPAAYILMRL
jgi:hypothetical protein